MITATERLGYPADARLLILNGDDIGMCHDTNVGTLAGLRDGLLTSASLMAPCPWALEAAELFAGLDVGVHLTITAEWRTYRWGPLTAECRQPASGLVDSTGSFWANDESVARNGSPAAARVEVYRQIEWALDRGLGITKLDGHMGTFYDHPEYLRIYLDAARDFRLPLRLPPLTEYLSRGGAAYEP